jgi:hypothetical protein
VLPLRTYIKPTHAECVTTEDLTMDLNAHFSQPINVKLANNPKGSHIIFSQQ